MACNSQQCGETRGWRGWAVKVWDRCVDNVTLASAVKVVGMGLIQQVRKHSSFALSDELRGIPVL